MYRLHLEPEDVEADNPDMAWDKLKEMWLNRSPILSKTVLVDERGFPISFEEKNVRNNKV